MSLLYFVLCCFGLTQILIYGSILDPIRPKQGKLGELFHCPMCLGFWIGLILWALNGYTGLFSFDNSLVTGVLLGCLSSGTSYVLAMVVDDSGLKLNLGDKHETDSEN